MVNMSTWFKLYREIFDSDLWYDVTTFRLFLLLLGKASHQDGVKVAGVELKRGQYLRSYRKLAEDLAYKEGRGTKTYSLKTIKKCIDKLIRDERVNVQETEQGTLFTILNYNKYQGFPSTQDETGNAIGSEVETNGKRMGNNNKNANNAKNIEEEEERAENPFVVYEQNFGLLKPILRESLIAWCEDLGDDIVIAGMKLAAQKGGNTFSYIEAIWKEWANQGLKTLDEVRAYELAKKKRNGNKVTPINRRRTVNEIDWDNL